MLYVFNDGGRSEAGFKGSADDCVVRAIAIAAERPYREVYESLRSLMRQSRTGRKASPRNRVPKTIYHRFILSMGAEWVPTMRVGSGCQVHLNAEELPNGRIVVRLSRHLAAVLDGVLHDTYDCSRDGDRCVYGYYHFG